MTSSVDLGDDNGSDGHHTHPSAGSHAPRCRSDGDGSSDLDEPGMRDNTRRPHINPMTRLPLSTMSRVLCVLLLTHIGTPAETEETDATTIRRDLPKTFFTPPVTPGSVLSSIGPTGALPSGIVYAYQGDNPDTASGRSAAGRVALKLLGGTIIGGGVYFVIALANLEWCDDNSPEDCGEERWPIKGELVLVPMGISAGVTIFDGQDRPICPLAASMLGFVLGFAQDRASNGGSLSLWLPVAMATVASEWSRDRPQSSRYSIGLGSRPGERLAVTARMRFR